MRLLPAAPIDGDIRCRLEQEGTQIAHGAGLIQAQQPYVRLLGDLTRFLVRAQAKAEKTYQGVVVLAKQALHESRLRVLLAAGRLVRLVGCGHTRHRH